MTRPKCELENCNNVAEKKYPKKRDGTQGFLSKCARHRRSPEAFRAWRDRKIAKDPERYTRLHNTYGMGYRLHKKKVCEFCGFTPEHPCQLDVDHINGNHSDNREENLRTLCANCHRLKSYHEGLIRHAKNK